MTVVGVSLVCAGLVVTAGTLFASEQVEGVYAAAKQTAQRGWDDTTQAVTGNPTRSVALGAAGVESDLDRCDGTFTQLTEYAVSGAEVPPVWAAHNSCGGDVILSWELGDRVTLTGHGAEANDLTGQVFEVVEVRHAPKYGGDVSVLDGMDGELVVQSCYYRPDTRMRFLALAPLPATEAEAAG